MMEGERKIPTRTFTPRANQLDPTFFRIWALSKFMNSASSAVPRSLRAEPPGFRGKPPSPVYSGLLSPHAVITFRQKCERPACEESPQDSDQPRRSRVRSRFSRPNPSAIVDLIKRLLWLLG